MPPITCAEPSSALDSNFTRDWLGPLCARRKFFIGYRALSGLGHWSSFISRGRRSRYYFCIKALAGHPLFDFPSDFISTISLGWAAHSLWLSLPLAACMAVGAALGPTDLVAFALCLSALAFPKRVSNILKGEGLLNDASGLVAFRVALAALATGSFSLGEAGVSLGISIIGGFAVGILTAFVNRWLQTLLLSVRASDIASELLLELSLPLLTFFLAEELHVSGIIAVVVSGILKASRFKHITLLEARVDTVSHTVWNTVNFILNGSVFVILGMELEMISKPILSSPIYNNLLLVLSVFLLTALLFLIRFVMLYLFYWFRTVRLKKIVEKLSKRCLIADLFRCEGNGFDCDDSFDSNQDRKRIPHPTLF